MKLRWLALSLAVIGQAALWAAPLFACACGPNCAARRTAVFSDLSDRGDCCAQSAVVGVQVISSERFCPCCCAQQTSVEYTALKTDRVESHATCRTDQEEGLICGRGLGRIDNGSCGCFHGPEFEVASQSAQPRSAVWAIVLAVAPLMDKAADLFAPKQRVSDLTDGLLLFSKARIQAVLCVWLK